MEFRCCCRGHGRGHARQPPAESIGLGCTVRSGSGTERATSAMTAIERGMAWTRPGLHGPRDELNGPGVIQPLMAEGCGDRGVR